MKYAYKVLPLFEGATNAKGCYPHGAAFLGFLNGEITTPKPKLLEITTPKVLK